MRFWRKKGDEGRPQDGVAQASSTEVSPRQPSGPPVKGTKVRLFLQPPGGLARLLEVELPDDGSSEGVTLRCFEPPPEGGRTGDESNVTAWKVDLDAEASEKIRELAADIRLVPLGGRSSEGDGSTIELTIAAGSAEARLTWWMAAPTGWSAAAELVDRLRRLSGEEF